MYCCNVLSSKLLPSTGRVKHDLGTILTRGSLLASFDPGLPGAKGRMGTH